MLNRSGVHEKWEESISNLDSTLTIIPDGSLKHGFDYFYIIFSLKIVIGLIFEA